MYCRDIEPATTTPSCEHHKKEESTSNIPIKTKMASNKAVKRQKVSHVSDGPAPTSKPEPTPVEGASPPPSSRDAEVPDDEYTKNAVETTPKTFKDLVCIGFFTSY